MKHVILPTILISLFLFAEASLANCNRPANNDAFTCMVCNCYYEARGESRAGQLEVGKTVMTRVRLQEYPNSVCAVVFQRGQFSWTFDKQANAAVPAGHQCHEVARESLAFRGMASDSFYNPKKAKPAWARTCKSDKTIGNHAFMSCVQTPSSRSIRRSLRGAN